MLQIQLSIALKNRYQTFSPSAPNNIREWATSDQANEAVSFQIVEF